MCVQPRKSSRCRGYTARIYVHCWAKLSRDLGSLQSPGGKIEQIGVFPADRSRSADRDREHGPPTLVVRVKSSHINISQRISIMAQGSTSNTNYVLGVLREVIPTEEVWVRMVVSYIFASEEVLVKRCVEGGGYI